MVGMIRTAIVLLLAASVYAQPAPPAKKAPPTEVAGIAVNYDEAKTSAYTLPDPLTYAILRAQQAEPQTQFAGVASPYTGFRILLPLPE